MKFSIIVPCYNCNNTIERVLDSIVMLKESDLEVILVDDTPDKGFYKFVRKYKKKLNVQIIETEHLYHNPGNSRNVGLRVATGDWVVFIDSDDSLRENALLWYSNAISSGEYSFIFGKMKQTHTDGTEFTDDEDYQDRHIVWLHGKCYNRQFLLDHNIWFKNNMFTCEDYYFNYQVMAHTTNEDIQFCNLDVFTYNWIWSDTSLSRSNGYVMNIRDHFYDHVEASLMPWVMIDANKNPDFAYKYYFLNLKIVYYLYLYYLKKSIYFEKDIVRKALSKIYEKFGITILDLINAFEDDYNESINAYKATVGIVNEDFVCPESFRTWLMNMSIC